MRGSRRALVGLGNLLAVLVLFFTVPVDVDRPTVAVLLSTGLAIGAAAVVGVVLAGETRAHLHGTGGRHNALQLVLLFELVFVGFALAYYSMAVHAPGQMAGLETRIDALYFTAVTMATVGYGEIHPVGQAARAVNTAHIIFDVVFIAAFARLIGHTLQSREQPSESPAEGDPVADEGR